MFFKYITPLNDIILTINKNQFYKYKTLFNYFLYKQFIMILNLRVERTFESANVLSTILKLNVYKVEIDLNKLFSDIIFMGKSKIQFRGEIKYFILGRNSILDAYGIF